MRQWYLDWRSRRLEKKTQRLKRKYLNSIVKQDKADELATNYWFMQQLKNGNNSLLETTATNVSTATDPIDSMLEVVAEATNVVAPPRTKATKQRDKATTVVLPTTKQRDNKALPAKTQGNNETTSNKASATNVARNILDNNPDATTQQALEQWQQQGNNATTYKSFRATFTREKNKRATK